MSFIQKSDLTVINTKLTSTGRLLLASGSLTFKKIEFGDSEIDYDFLRGNDTIIDGTDLIIIRPKDANPYIKYALPITDQATDTKTSITQVSPDIKVVTNTASQRGFFSGSTTSGFTSFTNTSYILDKRIIPSSGLTGSTILKLDSASAVTVGNMLLIDWRNPKLSAFTDTAGAIGESYPRPFIWYKALAVNGNNVTVDKTLPNFSGEGATIKSIVYVYPINNAIDTYYSTGTSISYWNDNTLAFNSNCNIASDNVNVWNFNILYKYAPAGVTNGLIPPYYDSGIFSGFKEYIQGCTTNTGSTMMGVIHFTNKSISNYYGEGFKDNTFKIDLPTIMYHAKSATTMGITLKSSGSTLTGAKKLQPTTLTGFTTEYYDLIETTSQNIVGKVFNDLKIAVIEDQEILNAMSLKSNRSWTLPNGNFYTSDSANSQVPILTTTSSEQNYLAITYLLASNNNYSSTTNYGFSSGIHCGYIAKLSAKQIPQVCNFQFSLSDLKFMQSSANLTAGTGFNANKLYIISQLVAKGDEPSPNAWKIYDYTSKLDSYTTWSATTIPVANLANRTYTFTKNEYTAGTTYDVTSFVGALPTTALPNTGLAFGEESILLGNVNTDIKALVYRTKIVHKLNFNQYNTSNNPTFENGQDDVYVTEAGIYDDNNNLVAIGKLNNPIKKNGNKLFTLELDMDF
jgi:hypothetical protein